MLSIISRLAQAQHGLGVQDKKSVWNIKNFPLVNSSEEGSVPQVSWTLADYLFTFLVFV